jgi:iron complex transport system substrate-binding protein
MIVLFARFKAGFKLSCIPSIRAGGLVLLLCLYSVAINAQVIPKRIISLSPSLTEMLYALDAGNLMVGVTRYCQYPLQTKQLPKIGGYNDPNYEAILSLHPDLILLLKEHRDARRNLKALGIPVLPLQNESVKGILHSIGELGQRVNREAQAEKIVRSIRLDFSIIKKATANLKPLRVLLVVGRSEGGGAVKSAYVAGREGFYTPLVRMAHATNAYQGHIAFPLLSAEGMIELKPDVIIDVTTDSSPSPEKTSNIIQQWISTFPKGQINASQIHVLSQDYMVIPGPRINLIARRIAESIHPEVNWHNQWAESAKQGNRRADD